ncbi:MAG: ion transporter [Bacteroidales bacterium]|nr:ion transporter [Bacteroidales bacterium]MCF8389146.1 ion transporter [Bacteroidales bacterium]
MKSKNWKAKLGNTIFESDTPAGKGFDVLLLFVIIISVMLVVFESIPDINAKYGHGLKISEWIITLIFSTEYILRITVAHHPKKYIFSFFGIIDLLSVIPTYLSLVFVGAQGLMVIRTLRLLRVFRILKLTRYTSEGSILLQALKASRIKISVFIFAILMIITIIGTLMYLIEGEQNGFTSIPIGIYWAIVTLTTVGYGDITPVTDLGKFISAIVMLLGYAIIVIPTGIVSAEMVHSTKMKKNTLSCNKCGHKSHEKDARFCSNCGEKFQA